MILTGTNCPEKRANDRSFSSRCSNATQGGHVFWPAIAKMGRPVRCEISVASSTLGSFIWANEEVANRHAEKTNPKRMIESKCNRIMNNRAVKSEGIKNLRSWRPYSIRTASCPPTSFVSGEIALNSPRRAIAGFEEHWRRERPSGSLTCFQRSFPVAGSQSVPFEEPERWGPRQTFA